MIIRIVVVAVASVLGRGEHRTQHRYSSHESSPTFWQYPQFVSGRIGREGGRDGEWCKGLLVRLGAEEGLSNARGHDSKRVNQRGMRVFVGRVSWECWIFIDALEKHGEVGRCGREGEGVFGKR